MRNVSFRSLLPLVLLLAALQPADAARPAAAQGQRPNVLFIAVDDLNDWIGALGGHPDSKTPHMDRLASRGMVFTRAFCAAPACNPSRVALLTGIRPSTSGVYQNSDPWRPAMPDVVTLPQLFMAHGYRVTGAGKIFHGRFEDPQSWQDYRYRGPDPKPSQESLSGLNRAHFDWGSLAASEEDMDDYKVVSWAIDQLQEKDDRPFFLAVGIFRPHLPWYVPEKYFEEYPLNKVTLPKVNPDDLSDVPPMGVRMARPDRDHKDVLEGKQWSRAVQAYLASIRFADDQIGRLLDALDRSGHADNTIVVLWGDHGWHLGEKLHWRKFTLWEEATRAPLIFVVPGVTGKGSRCERTVDFVHLYPTLADLCGLPVGDHLEGVSLRPLLENPAAEWNRPAITTFGRNNHGIRSERWRYIRYADGTEELYDHSADPLEWTNLALDSQYADVKRKLVSWLPKVNVPEVERQSESN